jgi:hypothetical protein
VVSTENHRGIRQTYIIKYLFHGVKSREEARLVGSGHFVRYTRSVIFSADDAVIGWIEVEFYDLQRLSACTRLRSEVTISQT